MVRKDDGVGEHRSSGSEVTSATNHDGEQVDFPGTVLMKKTVAVDAAAWQFQERSVSKDLATVMGDNLYRRTEGDVS